MNELINITSLVLGDWSHDGHSKSDVITLSSNLDKKAIEKAYKKGTKILGFDFINDVAADYEDHKLSEDNLNTLVEHGLKVKDLNLYNHDPKIGGNVDIWIDNYTHIYLFIIKLGNPDFGFKILKDEYKIYIGGYGLYY